MGFALGYVIGVVLAHFFGWRWAFMIVGLPGLITAWFVWHLREPVRGSSEHHERIAGTKEAAEQKLAETKLIHESWLRTSWRILRTRDWLLSTAGYTALTFVLGAFGTWATILLVRDKGLTVTQAGITLGLVSLFAGAAGTFGGGWLADKLIVRKRNAYFLLCAASSALGIIPVFVVLSANNPWIFVPAIFLSVFFLFINNAPFHAILINSVPPLVRATAVALNIVIIHIMGDVISRFGVGVLSDSIQSGHLAIIVGFASLLGIDAQRQHLTAALLVVPISLLLSSLLFLWGAASRKTVTI
jgi:predicted MFS family arabinose efflux permease